MRASSVEHLILATLDKGHAHLTAKQVHEALHKQLPAVNASTVYRALDRLVVRGEITVSNMGTGAHVFERLLSEPHHHLVCEACGQISTLPHVAVAPFFSELEASQKFAVKTNHLVLFGLCKKCRRSQRAVNPLD